MSVLILERCDRCGMFVGETLGAGPEETLTDLAPYGVDRLSVCSVCLASFVIWRNAGVRVKYSEDVTRALWVLGWREE